MAEETSQDENIKNSELTIARLQQSIGTWIQVSSPAKAGQNGILASKFPGYLYMKLLPFRSTPWRSAGCV